jgi:hypothetical protein
MREKLNENKAAQLGIIAVLAIVAIFFFMHSKGGGEEEEESASTEEAVVTTEVASTGETGGAGGALPTSVADTKAPPHTFRAAYESNQPVVLLIVHNGGIDDHYTELALHFIAKAQAREPKGHLEPFHAFVVPVKKINKYASVTLGLNITQVPALIVLRRRDLSHGEPQASVLYGFQTSENIGLALQEAEYKGPESESYHP